MNKVSCKYVILGFFPYSAKKYGKIDRWLHGTWQRQKGWLKDSGRRQKKDKGQSCLTFRDRVNSVWTTFLRWSLDAWGKGRGSASETQELALIRWEVLFFLNKSSFCQIGTMTIGSMNLHLWCLFVAEPCSKPCSGVCSTVRPWSPNSFWFSGMRAVKDG